MTLDLQAVARAIGAAASPRPAKVTGWSVDTRTQNPGDVYFALRGPNFDGNEFVPAAIERGAAAVVVTQAHGLELRGEPARARAHLNVREHAAGVDRAGLGILDLDGPALAFRAPYCEFSAGRRNDIPNKPVGMMPKRAKRL